MRSSPTLLWVFAFLCLVAFTSQPAAHCQTGQGSILTQGPGQAPKADVPKPEEGGNNQSGSKSTGEPQRPFTLADLKNVQSSLESIGRMDSLSVQTKQRLMQEIMRTKVRQIETKGVAEEVTPLDLALFANHLNSVEKRRKETLKDTWVESEKKKLELEYLKTNLKRAKSDLPRSRNTTELANVERKLVEVDSELLDVNSEISDVNSEVARTRRDQYYASNRFPGADDFSVRVAAATNSEKRGELGDPEKRRMNQRYQSAVIMNGPIAQEYAYLGGVYSGVGNIQSWNPAFGFDFYMRDPFDAPEYRPYLDPFNGVLSRDYLNWWPGDMFLGIEFIGPKQTKVDGKFATAPSLDDLKIETVRAITIDGGYFQPIIRVPMLGLMGETEYEASFGLIARMGVNYFYDPQAATTHRFNFEGGFRLSLIDTYTTASVSVNPPIYIDFLPYAYYQGDEGTYRPESRIEGRFLLPGIFNDNRKPLDSLASYMFVSAYLSEGHKADAINVGLMAQMSTENGFPSLGDLFAKKAKPEAPNNANSATTDGSNPANSASPDANP